MKGQCATVARVFVPESLFLYPNLWVLMISPGNDSFLWHQTHNGLVLWAQHHRQAVCELEPSLSATPLGLCLSLLFSPRSVKALSKWTERTDGRQILRTSKALLLLLFLPEYTANWAVIYAQQGKPNHTGVLSHACQGKQAVEEGPQANVLCWRETSSNRILDASVCPAGKQA